MELKEKLSTLESSVPPRAPGATSEVHGVKESGCKEGIVIQVVVVLSLQVAVRSMSPLLMGRVRKVRQRVLVIVPTVL